MKTLNDTLLVVVFLLSCVAMAVVGAAIGDLALHAGRLGITASGTLAVVLWISLLVHLSIKTGSYDIISD